MQELAEQHLPQDPNFTGLFLILVSKGPALVREVKRCRSARPTWSARRPGRTFTIITFTSWTKTGAISPSR